MSIFLAPVKAEEVLAEMKREPEMVVADARWYKLQYHCSE
jgi:hypothetical protein